MGYHTRLGIATAVEKISLVTSQRDLINDCIQIALDRLFEYYDWPYYLDSSTGIIPLVDNYDTGTCNATQGSATVTLVAPAVANAHFAGRKIRIGSDKQYYQIKSVNTGANTLTLVNTYKSSNVTGGTYEIYQDMYRLASDLDKYKVLRQQQNGIPLIDLTPTSFDRVVATPQNYADPTYSILSGTALDTYSVGTISGSGNTLSGTSTEWLTGVGVQGMGRLNKIRIGTNVYTIKSIDGDTQITTYESVGTIPAGTSYVIFIDNLIIQVYYLPDAERDIYYRYFRKPDIMANDYDIPDMPHEFHYLLIYGALSEILALKGDVNKAYQNFEVKFIQGLELMKMKLGCFSPDRIKMRRSTDRRRIRRDGLEPPAFDIRYSYYGY